MLPFTPRLRIAIANGELGLGTNSALRCRRYESGDELARGDELGFVAGVFQHREILVFGD
jgi:hypothetical protein